MSVGEQFDSGTVLSSHWKKLFSQAKVGPSAYLATFRQMAEKLPMVMEKIIELFKSQYGDTEFLNELREHQLKIIKRNLKLTAESTGKI
jgi:hypothetical protein